MGSPGSDHDPKTGAARAPTPALSSIPDQTSLFDSPLQYERWKAELQNPPERSVILSERALLPMVGMFGTAAESTWRAWVERAYEELCDKIGVKIQTSQLLYNPQTGLGEWKPADAVLDAHHLAEDAVIIFGLEKQYASPGSMAELGFMAAYSLLKSRKTLAFLKDVNPELGEDIVRARGQLQVDADYIRRLIPRTFIHMKDLDSAAHASFEERVRFAEFLHSPVTEQMTRIFMPRADIEPVVCISGSSTNAHSEERLRLMLSLVKADVAIKDTWSDNWSLEKYEREELPLKDRALVNTVLISDPNSLGAVKDVGLAVFRAIANGTYAVICFPEFGDRKSDYVRARTLALAHWDRLSEEFPWARHFVKFVQSPEEMAKVSAEIIKAKTSPEDAS